MSDLVIRSTNVPAEFEKQMEMARVFSASSLLPRHLQNRPENILVILDGARALDVPSFWAFQSMYVVEGKLALSAELMRALVVRAGHKFRIIEHSSRSAKVSIVRKDDEEFPFESEFTIEDAKGAGLTSKGTWKSYPKAMLLARATSQAVRAYCPDVLFGVVYTPEELGAAVDDEGKVVVDNTGKVVIEGTATPAPAVDQDMVDQIAGAIQTASLKDAGHAYVIAQRMDITGQHCSGNAEQDLLRLWVARLALYLDDMVENTDDLREVWQVANGTKVLDAITNDETGDTLGKLIVDRKARFEEFARAVNVNPFEGDVIDVTPNAEPLAA